jgi:AsmA protein
MPLERRHVRIPAAIALVAVAAIAVLWVGARTPFARGMIARAVSDAVGLPATVGALRLGFLPSLHLDIQRLAIAQPPGFGEEPLFEAGHIGVSLPWRRLLGMTDRLDAVSISQVMARLRVNANGSANWSALFPEPAAGESPAPVEPARWSIGALELADGSVDYRDAAADSQWQLTGITAKAGEVAPGAAFPLELQLGGLAGAQTMHFAAKGEARLDLDAGRYAANALEYRGWLGGDPLPLAGAELTGTLREASYESAAAEARFSGGRFEFAEVPGRFDGRLDFDEPALVADFEVATDAFGPRAPAIILGHPLPATRDPAAFESLQVAFRARMQDGELALDPLSGRLDDTNFEGRVIPGRRFVRASLDAIDFNRYLPPEPKPSGKPAAATPKATLESLISPLAKLDIDAEVRIGEARIAGARMRDAVLRVAPDGEGTQ